MTEEELLEKLHDEACRHGKTTYIDPKTGYRVLTAIGHRKRGDCCGCECRHCPYEHKNVVPK
ncbi:MAG: DUF5522 domain-containing protein [Myxococcota bacterium]|nr:DUF5522 domain-containing protein [Myxococcota bacterium]